MTAPLDAVRVEDIARYLAEFKTRVYPLEEVAEMTTISLRELQKLCRADKVEHFWHGRSRGMTIPQIEQLVATYRTGKTVQAMTELDEVEQARAASRKASRPSRGRRAA